MRTITEEIGILEQEITTSLQENYCSECGHQLTSESPAKLVEWFTKIKALRSEVADDDDVRFQLVPLMLDVAKMMGLSPAGLEQLKESIQ